MSESDGSVWPEEAHIDNFETIWKREIFDAMKLEDERRCGVTSLVDMGAERREEVDQMYATTVEESPSSDSVPAR